MCVCACVWSGIRSARNPIVLWLGILPLWEDIYFYGWIITPHGSISRALLKSGCPVVCLTTIMHAVTQGAISYMCTYKYFQIQIHTSNDNSYKDEQRKDICQAQIKLERPMLPCFQHERQFTVRESHDKLAIIW